MNSTQLTALITDLISQPTESEWVEFKENFHSAEEIGERISALANSACLCSQNYGYLIFGVKDQSHDIEGTTFKPKQQKAKGGEDLEHWLTTRLNPKADFKIDELDINAKRLVVFSIPAAYAQPVSFLHEEYVRVGSYTKKLKEYPAKESKIWHSAGKDWSATICQTATIADLSPLAISTARQLYISKNPHLANEVTAWNDETFLNKARLCIGGKITYTALLLLGLPESEHFISPAIARITWILRATNNIEKDYTHFGMPLLLATEQVFAKIRNLTYRYIRDGGLFPEEIDQYDPYVIRESLNNCIAHQDYTLRGKIIVVENEDATLTFVNSGEFIPQTIRHVIDNDAPERYYRNQFLADAMVTLKMIDTIGSGIKRMFMIQRERFFPLPDYDFSQHKVKVTITGKVLNVEYARKLAQTPNLLLSDIILLDRMQKQQMLTDDEITQLRKKGLVEGRKPSVYISSSVASHANLKKDYMDMRGLDDSYYESLVIAYLKKFGHAKRLDIDKLLLDKLSSVLDETQKKNKVRNMLQRMRNQRLIDIEGKTWRLISDN